METPARPFSWATDLRALTRSDLRRILRAAEPVTFPPGAMLCEENAPGDQTFYLRRGTVEIFKTSRGRSRTLAYRGRGEVVGEMALFEQRKRTASVRALDPVRALRFHPARVQELLGSHPELSLLVLEMMSHRLRNVQQVLLDDLMAKVEQLEEAKELLEQRVADRTRELQESNAALERLAVRDYLTGCFNRRSLMDQLENWCRSGQALGVVLMDIDHFKTYNDRNGHLVGDELLRGFVRVVQSQLRPVDVMARYGGEEFVLLLNGASPEATRDIAERVRARVEREDFPAGAGQPLGRVTLTAGLSCLPGEGETAEEVLRRADERLYRGKEAGRNRVVAADPVA